MTNPYPHDYGYPPPAKKRKKWPYVVGALVGIIVLAAIGSAINDGDDTSTASSAPSANAPGPAADTAAGETLDGLFQHPEDVTVVGCDREPTLGWPKTQVQIVNQSSKASTYNIRVSFQSQDGATQYGEGYAIVSSLAPGQSTTQTAQGLNEVPADAQLACVVTSAQRTEAL